VWVVGVWVVRAVVVFEVLVFTFLVLLHHRVRVLYLVLRDQRAPDLDGPRPRPPRGRAGGTPA
jgi:hypothetical protein